MADIETNSLQRVSMISVSAWRMLFLKNTMLPSETVVLDVLPPASLTLWLR